MSRLCPEVTLDPTRDGSLAELGLSFTRLALRLSLARARVSTPSQHRGIDDGRHVDRDAHGHTDDHGREQWRDGDGRRDDTNERAQLDRIRRRDMHQLGRLCASSPVEPR